MKKILIIGAGGHAKSCIDIESSTKYKINYIEKEVNNKILNYKVNLIESDLKKLRKSIWHCRHRSNK